MSLTDRQTALIAAAILFSGHGDDAKLTRDVLKTARLLNSGLAAPVTTRLAATLTVTDRAGRQLVRIESTGGRMSTAMTVDDVNVIITVDPEDDHGNETADQLTWTVDDNGSLLTATLSADTHTWTGVPTGTEGTVNISVSDSSDTALAPFVATIVIGPGATSQIVGSIVVTPPATA